MNIRSRGNIVLSKLQIKRKNPSVDIYPIKRVSLDRTRKEWELLLQKAKRINYRPPAQKEGKL